MSLPPLRAAIAAVFVAISCPMAPLWGQGGPAGVGTDFVEHRQVSETIPVFAQVVARRDALVAARVAGVVTNVSVQVGDRVKQEDALAELDPELLQIELQRAEAAAQEARAGIEVAEAGMLLAEQAFARVAGLRNTNAFSQGTFEDRQGALARAHGELAQAQARQLSAEADLARAAYNRARATIRAPFDAVVLEVAIDPGEYIQTGQQVARLIDVTDLEVEASVPGRYVPGLSEGQGLTGATPLGAPLELSLRAILPTESATTRTRPVRFKADLSASGEPVALGQSLTVNIPVTTAREALLVPKDAATQARGSWQVFVHQDGKAVPRQIQIGAAFGESFEVLAGLAPGDEVVVRGNERLRPMQDIAPRPVRPAPSAAAQIEDAATDPATAQAKP
ncbi:MAG: efflux RND transporter periplasmic adaptor subunit [Mangrovicoccus sp.]